jgi:hypothetical protein
MDAHQERMGASVNAWRKETKACREATEPCLERKTRLETAQEPTEAEIKTCLVGVEAMDLEKNPEEKEIVAEQRHVPKEEAAVKTVGAL